MHKIPKTLSKNTYIPNWNTTFQFVYCPWMLMHEGQGAANDVCAINTLAMNSLNLAALYLEW